MFRQRLQEQAQSLLVPLSRLARVRLLTVRVQSRLARVRYFLSNVRSKVLRVWQWLRGLVGKNKPQQPPPGPNKPPKKRKK